jgi:hypothetical protein
VIMNRRIRFRTYGGVRGRELKRLPPTRFPGGLRGEFNLFPRACPYPVGVF